MRTLYLDAFSGVAGDMFLGALLDVGVPLDELRAQLDLLGLDGFELEAEKVRREGLAGMRVTVRCREENPPRRGLAEIQAILAGSALPPRVKERAGEVFRRLAEAEAEVHGTTVDEIHFHEVGAIDAIVDVVGVCAGLELLRVESLCCSELPLGGGEIECAHGRVPVPAPATIALLRGVRVRTTPLREELVTPTGAALVVTLAERIGEPVAMVPEAVGYGFGSRVREQGPPNALRAVFGVCERGARRLFQLETNVDDLPGQAIGYTLERLLAAGALDAWVVPIQMKKSRPGAWICALADEGRLDAVEEVLFRETRTLGVRRREVSRSEAERRVERVETSWGAVRVKRACGPEGSRGARPEYEDVAEIARARGVPFLDVFESIRREVEALGAAGGSDALAAAEEEAE